MMTRFLMRLVALCVLLAPSLAQADSIVSMRDHNRDYALEGDVVTVWEDSFLFNDGSGQVIVDTRPFKTYDLGIAGRDYVQVVGRVNDDGVLHPLVINKAGREPVMFQGQAMLPPLPMNEVMKNTIRYRLPRRPAPVRAEQQAAASQPDTGLAAATRTANAPPGDSAESAYTSSGAAPSAPVQPVGATPAPAAPQGGPPAAR